MKKTRLRFTHSKVDYYFDGKMSRLPALVNRKKTIVITDENVFASHPSRFKGWNTIVLKAGESYKTPETVNRVVAELIGMEAGRDSFILAVGGGVITDLAGYVASIYMRGIAFGFVPTSLLGMVDASIGGKNGVDVGMFKNLLGTVNQPSFIVFDPSFLKTLPVEEWRNGFAEIIKMGCILDAALFRELEKNSLTYYQKNTPALTALIKRTALLKTGVVQQDEFETGDRKLLNFGHTLGHALENLYRISHGQAVAVGMGYASMLSARLRGFSQAPRVLALIEQYELPCMMEFTSEEVMPQLKLDKKRNGSAISFILLEKIGKAIIYPIPVKNLEKLVKEFAT